MKAILEKMDTRGSAGFFPALGLVVIVLVAAAGCRDKDAAGGEKVYPVKGKVLMADGKPLTSGRIVFVKNEGAISVEGKIGSDGTYSLNAGSAGEGAPEGSYKVRVEVDESLSPQNKGKVARRTTPPPFPAKYTDEDQSGLTATVKAGANDLEPFTLKK